jgi:menaquinone-dependent protoporphyrinogen IX oxidase
MKTLVIYKSKTGFTHKYARWIAEELQADLVAHAEAKDADWAAYDTIIYGGGLYVGGINGIELLKHHLPQLAGKRVIVYASGATPNRAETTAQLLGINFTSEEQKTIRFFYLRGGFDFSKLGIVDKVLMLLLKAKLRMKPESKRTPDERGMLAAYNRHTDFTRRRYTHELVAFAQKG